MVVNDEERWDDEKYLSVLGYNRIQNEMSRSSQFKNYPRYQISLLVPILHASYSVEWDLMRYSGVYARIPIPDPAISSLDLDEDFFSHDRQTHSRDTRCRCTRLQFCFFSNGTNIIPDASHALFCPVTKGNKALTYGLVALPASTIFNFLDDVGANVSDSGVPHPVELSPGQHFPK